MFIRVALDIPLSTLFDYSTVEVIAVGQRVLVPFGRQLIVGVVMVLAESSVLASERIVSANQLNLAVRHFLKVVSAYCLPQTSCTSRSTKSSS